MRRFTALLLCVFLACLTPSLAIIEKNPKYAGRSAKKGNATKTEDMKPLDLKTALNKALANSRQVSPRQFVRKHRMKITVALAIVAFRRELASFVWRRILSKPMINLETGEVTRRIQINPTAVLKIILFVDFMYRWQKASKRSSEEGDESDEESSSGMMSPLAALLLMGSRRNPASALLFSKMFQSSNSAYLPPIKQHYTFERVNERHKKDKMAFQKAINPKGGKFQAPASPGLYSPSKHNATRLEMLLGRRKQESPKYNETVIVLDMTDLDTSVSQMEVLRDQVSYLVSMHLAFNKEATTDGANDSAPTSNGNQFDEIIVLLESPGGGAADYSLASQQILRLRKQGIKVTICVDKVAASGGFMVAVTSSPGCLYAAPFAVLGSIGVLGQTFNIHERLENWGVKPLVFRGGKDKAPLGLVGEVTEEGIAKVQDMIDKTHQAFKRHVADCRPVLASDIDKIATGDIWLGCDALDLGLIDRVVTSDEYIGERISDGARVLKLVQMIQPRYPFQKPRTASARAGHGSMMSFGSIVSVLSDARAYFQRIMGTLGKYIVSEEEEGLSSFYRTFGTTTTLKSNCKS